MLNVSEFGARGDRQTNDRAAIQAAIDACSQAGGGTVYFPAGDYLSSTLWIKSHIALHLDAGATLWASTDIAHYNQFDDYGGTGNLLAAPLLTAEGAEHVSVVGKGTLHGQGLDDLDLNSPRSRFRTGIIHFQGCQHVAIRGITILYSDAWTVHLERCDTVSVEGVTILNNPFRFNSDGIGSNSCRNVHIANCHVVVGDDCIVLKSTQSYPCENVVITGCTLETPCAALKLGTESHGDFRDVHVSNCTVRNTGVGIGFFVNDGATMERITFSNISIETLKPDDRGAYRTFGPRGAQSPADDWPPDDSRYFVFPIFMDVQKRHANSRLGQIRDVIVRDIHAVSGSGILIQGAPDSRIENLTLQNVTLRVDETVDYETRRPHKAIGGTRTTYDQRDTIYAQEPAYVILAHVKGLTLDNVRVLVAEDAFRHYPRSAVYGHALEDGLLRRVQRDPVGDDRQTPVVDLEDCKRTHIVNYD